MYKQSVKLSPEETLQFDWQKNYANFSVYLNGQLLGSIPTKADLKLGRNFQLPERRQITVILSRQGLEAWHDGTDLLSGMRTGEADHFRRATSYLLWFGVAQGVFSLLLLLPAQSTREEGLALAVGILLSGALLVGLAFWAKKTSTIQPLWIAIGLLALNIALTLMQGKAGGIFISAIMIYLLYQGIRAGPLQTHASRSRDFDGNSPLDEGV